MFFVTRNTQLKSLYKFSYKFLFSISDVAHGRHHRRNANRLDILPRGPHTFPIGKNSFFTCRAHVHNPGLVKNLKWLAPNGMEIPQDDRYDNIFCVFLSNYLFIFQNIQIRNRSFILIKNKSCILRKKFWSNTSLKDFS